MPNRPAYAIAFAAACTSLFAAAGIATKSTAEPVSIVVPSDELQADYRRHVEYLADPRLEGRLPGAPGIKLAQDYIQLHFVSLGLEPAFPGGDDNSGEPRRNFRQAFEHGDNQTVQTANLGADLGESETIELTAGEDFNLLGYGGSYEGALPVTFAGYGIAAGNDGYLGFEADTDFTGRAVLLLRFEPFDETGRSKWTDEGWTFNSGLIGKIGAVARRNAAAIFVVNPPNAADESIDRLMDIEGTPPVGEPFDAPVYHITPELAERIVEAGDTEGRSLDDLIEMANEEGTVIDFESVELTLDAEIIREPVICHNVGAILPGRGELADEFVVIGAHHDHVGLGLFGTRSPELRGSPHPGADDNASGTSGVLLSAERLADAYAELEQDADARSILFMTFSAEEQGLIGSKHYNDNPIIDLKDHYAMVNMDMIGRYDDRLEIGGIASGEGLEDIVTPYFDASDLEILTSLSIGQGRSDHASFDAKGIPNLFFFTGLHDDYHAASDTADKLNIEAAAEIVSIATNIAFDLATRPEPLPYPTEEETVADEPEQPGRVNIKVRIGLAPADYSGRGGGLIVQQVFEGTSASNAGLEPGDRIIKWGDNEAPNVTEWMPLLAAHEPGDTVTVTIIRDGEELEIDMKLQGRANRGN